MYAFLRLLAFLVLAIVLLAGGAFLIPREATVTRSTTIMAPAPVIFEQVNSLSKTAAWSPWLARDPETKVTYEGPEAGVGNAMTWDSETPEVGKGRQEITASDAPQHVESALDFGAMGAATALFDLSPVDGGTEVVWTLVADAGNNPMLRWMNLMMDRWVGPDYEQGLANLKALVEGGGTMGAAPADVPAAQDPAAAEATPAS